MTAHKQVDKEIIEGVFKLFKAMCSIKGFQLESEEIKEFIEIALAEAEDSQYEILRLSYVNRLNDIGIAKELDCTIQQVDSFFQHAIFSILDKSLDLYSEQRLDPLNSLNAALDECIIELKEK